MKILNVLALFHNWLSDKDFIWWPFSFLRPEPKEYLTFKLTFLMTACFGGLAFMMFMIFAVVNNAFYFNSAVSTFFMCFFGFFIWFNLVTKPLWNHRAREINSQV